MEQPEPASDWPDRPLDPEEATALLTSPPDWYEATEPTQAVWVMDVDETVRGAVAPGADSDAVVDLVVETDGGYRMFSYSGGRWMDYGTQRKDDEDAPSMAGTLESYRVLSGEPDTEF